MVISRKYFRKTGERGERNKARVRFRNVLSTRTFDTNTLRLNKRYLNTSSSVFNLLTAKKFCINKDLVLRGGDTPQYKNILSFEVQKHMFLIQWIPWNLSSCCGLWRGLLWYPPKGRQSCGRITRLGTRLSCGHRGQKMDMKLCKRLD